MRLTRIAAVSALAIAASLTGACVPEVPGGGAATTIVYSGPRGNCDQEKVLTGARVRPCQGLANDTTSVIVSSKVLDPTCVDFYGYYPITDVQGTAQQGGGAPVPLTQTLTTPGSPAFDTGFDVDDGPITVTITKLTVDTGHLVCGWFGVKAEETSG
jgi:hypothetical protein